MGPGNINLNNNYPLKSYYLYNHIIKMDDNNNIIYANTNSDSEIIMIIAFKLLNSDKNLIINYYKIELKYWKSIIIIILYN